MKAWYPEETLVDLGHEISAYCELKYLVSSERFLSVQTNKSTEVSYIDKVTSRVSVWERHVLLQAPNDIGSS